MATLKEQAADLMKALGDAGATFKGLNGTLLIIEDALLTATYSGEEVDGNEYEPWIHPDHKELSKAMMEVYADKELGKAILPRGIIIVGTGGEIDTGDAYTKMFYNPLDKFSGLDDNSEKSDDPTGSKVVLAVDTFPATYPGNIKTEIIKKFHIDDIKIEPIELEDKQVHFPKKRKDMPGTRRGKFKGKNRRK
jgi:hypothetical protein